MSEDSMSEDSMSEASVDEDSESDEEDGEWIIKKIEFSNSIISSSAK